MTRSKSRKLSINYEKIYGKPILSRPVSINLIRLKKIQLIKAKKIKLVGLKMKKGLI